MLIKQVTFYWNKNICFINIYWINDIIFYRLVLANAVITSFFFAQSDIRLCNFYFNNTFCIFEEFFYLFLN